MLQLSLIYYSSIKQRERSYCRQLLVVETDLRVDSITRHAYIPIQLPVKSSQPLENRIIYKLTRLIITVQYFY